MPHRGGEALPTSASACQCPCSLQPRNTAYFFKPRSGAISSRVPLELLLILGHSLERERKMHGSANSSGRNGSQILSPLVSTRDGHPCPQGSQCGGSDPHRDQSLRRPLGFGLLAALVDQDPVDLPSAL